MRRGSISNDGTSIGGTTMFSGSIRSTQMADSVKKLDADLKKKLSNNFNSVRKAFLALDENHKGYISAEQLSMFMGQAKRNNMDFRVMEIAVKLNTKAKVTKVNYNDFCAWFGNAIEPKESFLFRHDSKKNP